MHEWESQVRDYEVDGYGGVNAATYLNYMEEARKHFLSGLGFDLVAMARRNLGFVVKRYEIDYQVSLCSGDHFVVETTMDRVSRVQVRFKQCVIRLPDRTVSAKSINFGLPINIAKNRPEWPVELDGLLRDYPIRGGPPAAP
jgi:acyl-CoA thioester hydrolase